ncbi:MAG: chloride channel protein [Nitrospiria bacterium]
MKYQSKRLLARFRRSGFGFLDLITLSEERTLMMLAVVVGLTSGVSAFVFKHMIDGVHRFCCDGGASEPFTTGHWSRMFLPAIGGLLVGLLLYYFDREAKGHGVPEIIYALRRRGGRIRRRVAFLTSIASALTIGTGGSAGTEGPIIQIGASVGSSIGQWFHVSPNYLKTLAAAGAAGGLAAVFNAPIAAVIFAMEVLLREFKVQVFSMVVFSSVIASVTSHVLLGDNTFLPTQPFGIEHPAELGLYFILGLIAAPLAKVFTKIVLWVEELFSRMEKIPKPFRPMVGGFFVGVLGLIIPMILGSGHFEVTTVLSTGNNPLQWGFSLLFLLVAGKMVATSVTLGSGGSGGDLMPSLFIGAMMGALFGKAAYLLFPNIAPPGAYALVGMGLIFSVVANAPVTAIMMMFEITQDYRIILPLMFSVTITMLMSQQMGEIGIYGRVLLKRGIRLEGGDVHDPIMSVTVDEVMVKNVEIVWQNMTVEKLTQFIEKSLHTGFPVVNAQGDLLGMVTYAEIHKAAQEGLDSEKVLVDQIMRKDVPHVFPEEVLVEVVRKMQASKIDRVAVVEPENPQRLVGLITRTNIMSAYQTEFQKST